MKKIFKGVIQSLLPQKGFGFISPVWANGDSEENIFFHLSETKGGKCYIPALASADNRQEVVSKKGTVTLIPNDPQVVFFELSIQELKTGEPKFIAKKLRDAKHVSEDEAKEADENMKKPSAKDLLQPETDVIDLSVKVETVQTTEEPAETEECTSETVEVHDNANDVEEEYCDEEYDDYEEEDDEKYAEYDDESWYTPTSKSRKDNKSYKRND